MIDGVNVALSELIALQRHAQMVTNRPLAYVLRAGHHPSKLRGRGMDFSEVRNYQAGDEIRHMEWRVTARTGKPHIKLYQEERERPVVILLDYNASMYFGTRFAFKSVLAARLAALIAWTVSKQGDRIGGLLFSSSMHNEFMPRGREAGVLPLLAAICQYTNNVPHQSIQPEHHSLSHALQRVRRVARPGSLLVLISDFYNMDGETEQHLSRLRSHNDILAYHLCDPLELAPPKPQLYAISDGEQELLLDTTVKAVNQAYMAYCKQRMATLLSQFQRLKIQYLLLTAAMDLPMFVRQNFPRRARD